MAKPIQYCKVISLQLIKKKNYKEDIQVNGVKILNNEGHLKRFTELHEQGKREEGDKGDQGEKRGS